MTDDDLGIALSDALHAFVSDIEPSPQLLDRVDRIGRSPIDRSRRVLARLGRHRLLAAIPIPVAAAVTALILLLGGSEVTPSFAVVQQPDGAVLVTIHDLAGVAGANARLRQLGLPALVVPMTADCPTRVDLTYLGVQRDSIRLTRATLPANTTIILAARRLGPNNVEMAIGRVTGTPPPCVSSHGTGPGLPGWPGPSGDGHKQRTH